MSGLGKPRSKVGEWLDSKGIKQGWLMKKANISKGTTTNVCSDPKYIPSGSTMMKLLKALKEVDPSVSANKFWDI